MCIIIYYNLQQILSYHSIFYALPLLYCFVICLWINHFHTMYSNFDFKMQEGTRALWFCTFFAAEEKWRRIFDVHVIFFLPKFDFVLFLLQRNSEDAFLMYMWYSSYPNLILYFFCSRGKMKPHFWSTCDILTTQIYFCTFFCRRVRVKIKDVPLPGIEPRTFHTPARSDYHYTTRA